MSIEAIGSALGMAAPAPIAPIARIEDTGQAGAASTVAGGSFAEILASGISNVQSAQSKADGLAVQAATGDLTDIHDYTVAAAEAKLATSLTVALRDKAVGAFNEIMRMQA